jgi:soluble lytic murein transglycosylase-like protein
MPSIPNRELLALAHDAARAHNLSPELVCAIIEQESGWDPWAARYEPEFFARYIEPALTRSARTVQNSGAILSSPAVTAAATSRSLTSREGFLNETESRMRAFSWGLMQVMGQVAREHGFNGTSLAQMCDPQIGLDIGCRVFAAKLAAAEGNVPRALLLWNGGANRGYAEAVLARTHSYATLTASR